MRQVPDLPSEQGGDISNRGGKAERVPNWVAALVLTVGLVALLAIWLGRRHEEFRWDLFAATFSAIRWRWMAAATGLALMTYLGRVIRWAVMLRPLRPNPSYWNLLKATLIGFTAVVLLGRPGELVRPYLIAIKERTPFASQMAIWVLERVADLLVVLWIFGASVTYISSNLAGDLSPGLAWVLESGGRVVWMISGGCITLMFLLARFAEPLRRWVEGRVRSSPHRVWKSLGDLVGAAADGVGCIQNITSVVLIVLYTAVEWLLIVGCYVCLFRSFEATEMLGLMESLAFLGFLAFGSIVQIPGVGGGVQVVAVLVLTELFGVRLEAASGVAVAIWLVTFASIAPIGVPLALHEGFQFGAWRVLRERVAGEAARP